MTRELHNALSCQGPALVAESDEAISTEVGDARGS
jgi:hypothetical protein